MFEDSLFATNPRRNPQRRWAAFLSFVLQAALVTILVALPLFFTQALPISVQDYVWLPAPPVSGPPPAPPHEATRRNVANQSNMENGVLIAVREIPKGPPKHIVDDVAPPQLGSGPYIPGATGSGPGTGVISDIINEAGRDVAIAKAAPPSKPVVISHISEGLLIQKITPVYPQIAKIAHQQGAVVLHAIIGRDGRIEQLQAVSGPPLLVQAAVQAVQQWRYRPYILNGQPVEVETQITVNFKLGG